MAKPGASEVFAISAVMKLICVMSRFVTPAVTSRNLFLAAKRNGVPDFSDTPLLHFGKD
jgi:hypothetical protein